jgi:hypothetical protein
MVDENLGALKRQFLSRLRKNTIRKDRPKGSLSPTIGVAWLMSSLGTDQTGGRKNRCKEG